MNLVLRNGIPLPVGFRPGSVDEPFENLVESMFENFFAPSATQETQVSRPRMNVAETDKTFEVEAELPGATKEDVKISVDGSRVSIEAEVKRESTKKEGETVVYAERVVSKFARSFTLPADVDDA